MDNLISFGRWLRRRRKALDLTQQDLARLVGCSAITVRKIESDERRPSKAIAARLAECLDLPTSERADFLAFARGRGSGRLPSAAAERPWDTSRQRPSHGSAAPLIGRHYDLAEIRTCLLRDDTRLLTLIGPPGIGKTRLALCVAEDLRGHFADGVCLVALAPLSEPDLVPSAIAQALGVQERGDQPPLARVVECLAGRELLLVLDNFEQVLGAAPALLELLAAAARLKLLVTSRATLGLRAERIFVVPPLVLPDQRSLPPVAALAHYPAVMLFIERAQLADPSFRLSESNARQVAAIVARLDGLPLAIELVAARVAALPPTTLLARLADWGGTLNLPAAPDAPHARHRTLSAAIDWSYQLLRTDEQAFFRQLGVFVGGCALADVAAVSGLPPALASRNGEALLGKSLLQHTRAEGQEPRLSLLEIVREYALNRLRAAHEEAAARQRHTLAYLALAEEAAPALTGPEPRAWVQRLEREHDNLRAALTWALEQQPELATRLARALWRFWYICCYFAEGRRWLDAVLAMPQASPSAQLLYGAGILAREQGDYAQAEQLEGQSLVQARAHGDALAAARALYQLALLARDTGDEPRALALHEECLALQQRIGDRQGIADSLNGLGNLLLSYGETARALDMLRNAAALQRALGNRRGVAFTLHSLGLAALTHGSHDEACACFDESLAIFQALGDRLGIADCTIGLAAAAAQEQPERAVCLWAAAEARRATVSASLAPSDWAVVAPFLTQARAQLSVAAFRAAWDEGLATAEHDV